MKSEIRDYVMENFDEKVVRRLSDMKEAFEDQAAVKRMLAYNPILYTVHVKHEALGMSMGITTMNPGTIGKEFFMTKGHDHPNPSAELYVAISGRTALLMQKGSTCKKVEMEPGKSYIVPEGWAHRTINVGEIKSQFITIYAKESGHNYDILKNGGFKERIFYNPISSMQSY